MGLVATLKTLRNHDQYKYDLWVQDMADDIEKAIGALRGFAVTQDEMSYHGELLRCRLCNGIGTRSGYKRGVEDTPVKHTDDCLLSEKD